MWQIENRTPFAAAGQWTRARDGAETWLVVVQATFTVADDGTTAIARAQPAPNRVPVFRGDPADTSLFAEADFPLEKVATDVVVEGVAHAPGGQPVPCVDVALHVGSMQKVLRVFGDRVWSHGGLSSPAPFGTMPIVYERAFGGVDRTSKAPDPPRYLANPVGRGFFVEERHGAGAFAPNVEYPNAPTRAWDDRPPVAGFGPVASHWAERAAFAGTYDDAWMRTRQPLLPDDYDVRHGQAAPADQQVQGFLRGGENVDLVNLTPHGRLRFALPAMAFALETRFHGGSWEPHAPPRLHTVRIEPAEGLVSLVWHSALACHPRVYQLEKTRVTEHRVAPAPGQTPHAIQTGVDNLLDLF